MISYLSYRILYIFSFYKVYIHLLWFKRITCPYLLGCINHFVDSWYHGQYMTSFFETLTPRENYFWYLAEYFDSSFTDIYFQWTNEQHTRIDTDDGLVPNSKQTIVWSSGGLVYWRICVTRSQWIKGNRKVDIVVSRLWLNWYKPYVCCSLFLGGTYSKNTCIGTMDTESFVAPFTNMV